MASTCAGLNQACNALLKVEDFLAHQGLQPAVTVDIGQPQPSRIEALHDTVRRKCAVASVLEPVGPSQDVQPAVAVDIADGQLFAVANLGERAPRPGTLAGIGRYLVQLGIVIGLSVGVVIAHQQRRPAPRQQRRDGHAMRPVAHAPAYGVLLPASGQRIHRLKPAELTDQAPQTTSSRPSPSTSAARMSVAV